MLALEKQKNHLREGSGPGREGSGGGDGGQLATMEMQVLNEKQRAELATVRYIVYVSTYSAGENFELKFHFHTNFVESLIHFNTETFFKISRC